VPVGDGVFVGPETLFGAYLVQVATPMASASAWINGGRNPVASSIPAAWARTGLAVSRLESTSVGIAIPVGVGDGAPVAAVERVGGLPAEMFVSGVGLVGGRTLAEHLAQALEDVLLGLLFLLVGVFGGGTCVRFSPPAALRLPIVKPIPQGCPRPPSRTF
jgi:hypothetical protein